MNDIQVAVGVAVGNIVQQVCFREKKSSDVDVEEELGDANMVKLNLRDLSAK